MRTPSSVISPSGTRTSRSVGRRNVDLLAQALELVWPRAEHRVELLGRHRHEVRVGDPRAVEAVAGLAPLVVPDPGQRDLVDLGVAAARDERRHAADGVGAAAVARLHEELGVGAHEGDGHRHLRAVGKDEVVPLPELLDDAEDVVPATRVEAGGVVAQLVEDLLHLERGQDRLDQHGRLDRPRRQVELLLGEDEDVVPQARLEVALELRQVEVRPAALVEQAPAVVEEVEAEVEEAAGDQVAVDEEVALREVPAARPHQERRPGRRRGGSDFSPVSSSIVRSIASIRLAWPSRMLRHVGEFASSKSAMKHRAPELSALMTILRSTGPVISTRRSCRSAGTGATRQSLSRTSLRLRQEVGQLAGVEARLALDAGGEQLAARPVEAAVELGDEGERVRAQDLLVAPVHGRAKLQPSDLRAPRAHASRGRGRGRSGPGKCTRPARPSSRRESSRPCAERHEDRGQIQWCRSRRLPFP